MTPSREGSVRFAVNRWEGERLRHALLAEIRFLVQCGMAGRRAGKRDVRDYWVGEAKTMGTVYRRLRAGLQ